MAGGVAGNVDHAQRQTHRGHLHDGALLHWHKRLGNGLARWPIDHRTAALAQRLDSADVVAVVVRD